MNKNKSISLIISSVAIIVVLVVVFLQQSNKKDKGSYTTQSQDSNIVTPVTTKGTNTTTTATKNTSTETKTQNPGQYTLAQVAAHKSSSDCWTTINGSVYNVTSWINEHPGGAQAIISLCGIDGSDVFNGQHGGERRPANELASFKIGTLVK